MYPSWIGRRAIRVGCRAYSGRYRRGPNPRFSGLAECTAAGRALSGQAQANAIRDRESFCSQATRYRKQFLWTGWNPCNILRDPSKAGYVSPACKHCCVSRDIDEILISSISPLGLSARHAQNSHESLRGAGLHQRHSAKLVNGQRRSHRNCRNIYNNRSVIPYGQTA